MPAGMIARMPAAMLAASTKPFSVTAAHGSLVDEYRFLHFPADAVRVDARVLQALPPSARRVFASIREDGPLTHADLREATDMPPRTIRFAIKRLREAALIDTRTSLRDCRTCYYFVHPRILGEDALEDRRLEARHEGRSMLRAV